MTHQNYARQILQNRSFKGLDLTGADFSGSDLRGCDFTGVTLVGASLAGVRTGQSRRQVNMLIAATIFGPMGLTIGLIFISFSNFIDGSGAQGLFLLVLAGICALLTHRIFKWVIHSIYDSCGTSFRKASLTDANHSHAMVKNTDFCWAVLTGACIFEWMIQRHAQFANVDCEYLYLEPARRSLAQFPQHR